MHPVPTFWILAAIAPVALCDIFGTLHSNQAGIQRRRICPSVPDTTPLEKLCSLSCGTGYTQCTDYYSCFNPGEGQICCDDGSEQCFTCVVSLEEG